jgi:hypothetical protein
MESNETSWIRQLKAYRTPLILGVVYILLLAAFTLLFNRSF